MKTATASKRAGGRLREVDGLRALAILAVMTSRLTLLRRFPFRR